MLVDLGLDTSYVGDGRAITEVLAGNAAPTSLNRHRGSLQALGQAFKQLNAPFGSFGMATLAIATDGIQTEDEDAYAALDARLDGWGARRDALAGQIRAVLSAAESGGSGASESTIRSLTRQATALVAEVAAAAP